MRHSSARVVYERVAKRGGHCLQTLQSEKTGTERERWMCALGGQSGCSTEGKGSRLETTTPHAPRYVKDEELSTFVHMVARDGLSIEGEVQSCHTCQENKRSPAAVPRPPWEWPETPWNRLHVDYAGPFLGKMFLIVVDAHSK